eukprot:c17775_g1_i2 orf=241-2166(-)
MIEQLFSTSKSAIYSLLQDCNAKKDLLIGREVHSLLISHGYESKNTYGSQLIRLYTALGHLQEATLAFSQVSRPNLCVWSTIIAAYAKVGDATKTLELYERMQQCGVKPNSEVFLCMLKVCSSQGLISTSHAIELLKRQGFPLSNNVFHSLLQGCLKLRDLAASKQLLELMKCEGLSSVALFGDQLIRVFALCGSLQDAKHVFEMVAKPSAHTWNAIISAHVSLGESEHALYLFYRMQLEGIQPNEFIFTCTLKACGITDSLDLGRLVHFQIVVFQMDSDVSTGNALVDAYSKCGDLEGACKVFNDLAKRDVVSWGSMTVGFSQHGHDLAVVELYEQMEKEGVIPNRVIFLHVMKACGRIGALGHGRLVHGQILKHELQFDALVGSALVDMYAICGNLKDLQTVFDRLPSHDVISWGAMIGGYVQHGDYQLAAQYLEDMQQDGLKPDNVIFTSILTACSHAGLVDMGFWHFKIMTERCGITPSTTHYNCLIDLLARMGCLDEAKALLHTMPASPDIIGWKSLLTSCRTHSNMELGARCFHASVQSDPRDSAGYILMSNIYAEADMWEDVGTLHVLRKSADVAKLPGKAWIEINAQVDEFIVGQALPVNSKIDLKLERVSRILKQDGYVAQLDLVIKSCVGP